MTHDEPSTTTPFSDDTEAVSPRQGGGPSAGGIQVGSRVGPYRIIRHIAHGGMGTVYLAEREDHFKQRVALKTLHPDKTTDSVLKRFYAERQILADLDHPHIARIYDGGATAGTLPFFVMEYVEGEPFDLACRALDLRGRLKLFQKICGAVHHAHRSLIVHRDLKPSNILVTESGEPKLLDFGIAKLLGPDEDGGMARDRTDLGPMTVAFASPEQLSGEPLTIGTDIYSLGVLLYKVLTGRHPHHRPGISTGELMRAICFEAPALPSDIAEPDLAPKLAGDLDAILLKTLAKRPEARYDSAAQLAEEIQAHLEDRPIRAWRGTWAVRLRKRARRNKLGLVALVTLLTFTSTVTLLWRHAVTQQVAAEQARVQAERTRDFILDFFEAIEPDRRVDGALNLKNVLDSGRRTLEKALHDEPEVRADLLGTLATVYYALALHDDALNLQIEAVEVRRATHPVDPRKLAVDLNNLASSHFSQGRVEEAETLFREAITLYEAAGDRNELKASANLAVALSRQGKIADALETYEKALLRVAEESWDNAPVTADVFYGLGAAHKHRGNYPAAATAFRRALRIYDLDPQTKPTRLGQVKSSLGEVLHELGRLSEARIFLEETLAIRRRVLGDDHPSTAGSRRKLAQLLMDLGELEQAEALLKLAGGTYDALGDDVGAARVREAQVRLEELAGPGDS